MKRSESGILLLPLVVFLAALWAALSVDIVRTGFGVKGDEATYVAMGLSLAHDGDLAFERKDLERFYGIYQSGPEGIFLKRGRHVDVAFQASWPFARVANRPASGADRLYFGKAYLYSAVAAPLVRLFGVNGFLVLHVLLLAGVLVAGYAFVAARSPAIPAVLFATAFLGASVVPVYAFLLHSDTLNLSLVFYAYFFWLYKEVAPQPGRRLARWLSGPPSDVIAAVLLGLATFSKPSNLLLILPLIGLAWWRRRFVPGLVIGLVFAAVVAAAFGLNAAVSGEPNYQGGDRKTFYGRFPFETPGATFENRGAAVATDALEPAVDVGQFVRNVRYFLVGRHFGLLPFCFPAVVAVALALLAWRAFRAWHALVLAAIGATGCVLLVWLPFTWAGGGGLPGNRYFLSVYPAFFFLAPPLRSVLPGLAAWAGGALFTAHILMNPFVASKQPWTGTQQGALRWLPVELSAAYDLPAFVSASRCRIQYSKEPYLQLCYLDEHAFPPEPAGIWIAGASRAEIIMRSPTPITSLTMTLYTPTGNRVRVRSGGVTHDVELEPQVPAVITFEPFGVLARFAYAYLVSIETERGFVPRLTDAGSKDSRFLGVQIRLTIDRAARTVRR